MDFLSRFRGQRSPGEVPPESPGELPPDPSLYNTPENQQQQRQQQQQPGRPPVISGGEGADPSPPSPDTSTGLREDNPDLPVYMRWRGLPLSPDGGDEDPDDETVTVEEEPDSKFWWLLMAFLLIGPVAYFFVPQVYKWLVILLTIVQITTLLFVFLIAGAKFPPLPPVLRSVPQVVRSVPQEIRKRTKRSWLRWMVVLLGIFAAYNVGNGDNGSKQTAHSSSLSQSTGGLNSNAASAGVCTRGDEGQLLFPLETVSDETRQNKKKNRRCLEEDYEARRDPSYFDDIVTESALRKYRGNQEYAQIISDTSRKMVEIVESHWSSAYDPTSEDVPLSEMMEIGNSIRIEEKMYWRNLLPVTSPVLYGIVNTDIDEIIKVGYTSNFAQRLEEYREERGDDYFRKNQFVRLVNLDTIRDIVDRALVTEWIEMMEKLIAIENLHKYIRRWLEDVLDSYFRGGVKKQDISQLIEIGLQKKYELQSPGEGFMYDLRKEKRMKKVALETATNLCESQAILWGEGVYINADENPPVSISTWITGQKKTALSSFYTVTRYVLGNEEYYDTIEEPLFPNAETEEEIFAHDFSPKQKRQAKKRFRKLVRKLLCNPEVPGIMFVDSNDYIFPSIIEPQMILCEEGCDLFDSHNGGEIIEFHCSAKILYLHGHPANVCDSRSEFPIRSKQIRAITMDALRLARQCATGVLIRDPPEEKTYDAIHGSVVAEILDRGKHGSRLFSQAVCHDQMSIRFGVDAIERYGGPKQTGLTEDDISYPAFVAGREYKSRAGTQQNKITQQMFVDEISQRGIDNSVQSLLEWYESTNTSRSNIDSNFRTVYKWFKDNEDLQERVRESIERITGVDPSTTRTVSPEGTRLYDILEAKINEYKARNNGSAIGFRFYVVKNGQTYAGDEFDGLPVVRIFWEGQTTTRLVSGVLAGLTRRTGRFKNEDFKFKTFKTKHAGGVLALIEIIQKTTSNA